MFSCPFSPPPLGLRSPVAFHGLQKYKNSLDFWSEPFIVFERWNNPRLKHPGGFWWFTASDFSDSQAWCVSEHPDTPRASQSLEVAAWSYTSHTEKNNYWVLLQVSEQERRGLASQCSIHSSSLSPPFLFTPNVLLFSKVGFEVLIHSHQPYCFIWGRLGLRMLWFCSVKTPLEIAACLTWDCYLCSNNISFKDEEGVFFSFLFKYRSIVYESKLPLSFPWPLILSFNYSSALYFMVLSLTGNISLLFFLTCTIKDGRNSYLKLKPCLDLSSK